MEQFENLLTIQDVADKLKVTPQYARKLIKEGKLAATKLGIQWVVNADDLEKYIQEYDVITEIDGKKISSKTDIQTNLYSHSIGDTIKVTFYRGKDKKTVDLKLTKSTEDISD